MRAALAAILVFFCLCTLSGCGGGGPSSSTGRAVFTVQWPDRSRLIPVASNSIRVEILRNGSVIASQLLARPANGTSTTASFANLPIQTLTARATAYPQSNGSGIAQASGGVPLVIQAGQTAAITLTMASTIDHIDLAPANPAVVVGSKVSLTATAKDASGSVVLTSASKLTWSSSNTSKATVDANGQVSGVSAGTASVTVTDQESGKSASANVTVSQQVIIIDGKEYVPGEPNETLSATFTVPDGGVTTSSYSGYVLVNVTGVGQAYGGTYNDAFYLYTAPFDPPQNGHDGGYYQLAFGTTTLTDFSLASNAKNFLYGSLPAYTATHDYTFVLNTKLATAGKLHFGVTDGGYSDNAGAYTIKVTQLIPAP